MKIVYIAPLPPPLAGHSLAAKVLHDHLQLSHEVAAVDFNKESFVEGISGFKRVFEVIGILREIALKKKNADVIYLTISESFAGNVKDIITYIICRKKLNRMYIHLHGGSIKRLLWDKYPLLHKINRYFIKKMAGVIISGQSHMEVFSDMIDLSKIYSIPNFALDELFATDEQINQKFADREPFRVLYMSNMIDKKGYYELASAYITLPPAVRSQLKLDFAGRFELETQKTEFLEKIAGFPNMKYHGMVSNEVKRELFLQAHAFCLPTSFFEGQPISILEAYAAGCVVITTGQSGILDVFTDKLNGFQLQNGKVDAIRNTLEELVKSIDSLQSTAMSNAQTARRKYRTEIYNAELAKVLEQSLYI